MTTRYSFTCNQCWKEFEIKGHWYNQMLMHWFLDYKYMWHEILKHRKPILQKNNLRYIFRIHVAFMPLLILQIMDILAEPFRRL